MKDFDRKNNRSKNSTAKSQQDSIRLNKFIAHSGICSRREADMFIELGVVTVNGKLVTAMGAKVKPTDLVVVDGQAIKAEKPTYILLNKPKGFGMLAQGERGTKVVEDLLLKAPPVSLTPLVRLDRQTSGLVFFTNDELMLKKLKTAQHNFPKLFHVVTKTNVTATHLKQLTEGVELDGNLYKAMEVSHVSGASKREVGFRFVHLDSRLVKRMFEALNLEVLQLDLVMLGQLTKKDLPRGHWRNLSKQELNSLQMV